MLIRQALLRLCAGRVTAAVGNSLASQAAVTMGGGRSSTGPRWLLLPSGCSVVVIPIIGIIKIFFFFSGCFLASFGVREQLQPWWAWAA